MPRWDQTSYTGLVYEVLRSAGQPLTFQEIFDEVNRRQPLATRNPKATIRNALTQGTQLVSMGDGRYGYLPHLIAGSLLRVPLTEKKPANHPLVYPFEARVALWPSSFEIQKRKDRRPARMRLPNGDEVDLHLEFLGPGVWGSPMPDGLRRYMVENHASEGTSLLIRVIDGETGRCEAWLEPGMKRDAAAVSRRNRELADIVYQLLRKHREREMPIWDLAIATLARGVYRADVPPDPLETVLKVDSRFQYAGLHSWTLAENVTPELRALFRRREEIEGELFEMEQETSLGAEQAPSPQVTRRSLEQSLADMGAILSQREFGSIEEANAFLQDMLAQGGIPHRTAMTPLEKAQDLMYEAWEAPTSRERVRLAKKALEISPDCADAYVLLAEETTRSAGEAAELFANGVAAGERALGKRIFEEEAGHFWGMIETRPYMRARDGLAHALWEMGLRKEAIDHVWDMLRLNPGDNQGMRYVLLNWLLVIDDAQIEKLLSQYPDDIGAAWLYGWALHTFRNEGDTDDARKRRAEAKQMNPYVPNYLLGRKPLPRQFPETIGLGDKNEAIVCASDQMDVWRNTPGALTWLDEASK